jgi:predicted nuclease with TOPRIM domain
MDYESQLNALESRLLAVIETRDRSMLEALEKVNLRLEKHSERIKDILERLRELEEAVTKIDEKVEDLDLRKLDELDDREVKSREERSVIFDQFMNDQEQLLQQAGDSGDSDELDARLNLIATRLAEIERIVRTQIR